MKRALAGSLALLIVALLAIWRYSRSEAPGAGEESSAIASERAGSQAAPRSETPRRQPVKPPVPAFDDRPALRAQIDELLKEREARKKEEERKCATTVSSTCPFLTPSQEILREMARCAVVRADMPIPPPEDPTVPEDPSMEPVVAEVTREFWQRTRPQLEALHRDLVRKPQAPGAIGALLGELQGAVPVEVTEGVHRAVARERAGLAPSPTAEELARRPAGERFWRMRLRLGDDYEDMLARKLGAARARALRAENDGWPGRAVFAGQCDPPLAGEGTAPQPP